MSVAILDFGVATQLLKGSFHIPRCNHTSEGKLAHCLFSMLFSLQGLHTVYDGVAPLGFGPSNPLFKKEIFLYFVATQQNES